MTSWLTCIDPAGPLTGAPGDCTLPHILQPLEREGLVQIRPFRDSRASCARLSAKGRRLLARTLPLWDEAQTRFEKSIGIRRWKGMLGELNRVVDAAHGA